MRLLTITAVLRIVCLGACLGAGLVAVRPAAAETKADALFKKGKKLLADKRYPDACAAFEESDKLDPGIGAKLNVAKCYEEWGKLAVAYRWYHDAETMAAQTKDDRVTKIHERAEELDGSVPRLTIKLPAGAPTDGLTITLDGKHFAMSSIGEDQRVDPGPHVIDYEIGGVKKNKVVPVERGGSSEVTLDIPHDRSTPPDHSDDHSGDRPHGPDTAKRGGHPDLHTRPDKEVDPDERVGEIQHPGRGMRIAGVTIASLGVVGMGVAGYITLHARSRYRDALSAHCSGDTAMCDAEGLTITHDSRHQANIATVVTIIGAAAVIGGVVLYLASPKGTRRAEHALYISPSIGGDGGGLVLGGRY